MPDDREQLLERYLDGELTGRDRRALEKTLGRSPDLREALALQRRIDTALRDVFARGAPEPATLGAIGPGGPSWRRLALYAAAVVVVSVAGLWVRLAIHQRNAFNPMNSPHRIYDRLVERGFEPEFVCEPGPEFIAAVEERFGAGLNIAEAPGVDVIGWAYDTSRPTGAYSGQILSEQMLILMAYVDREPVIVLMDERGADTRPRLDPASDLRLFRGQTAGFVLYEVTPHPRPRLLPGFEAP
jgi:hypothetical protein